MDEGRLAMLRADHVVPRGTWTDEPVDRVRWDYEARHRRRITATGEGGLAFLLDLPEVHLLREGDGLVLEDGRIVEVEAIREPLIAVHGADAYHLTRIAWHLGNRHVPAMIEPDRILIRRDRILEAMLDRLGGRLEACNMPFEPELGAYASHGHADA